MFRPVNRNDCHLEFKNLLIRFNPLIYLHNSTAQMHLREQVVECVVVPWYYEFVQINEGNVLIPMDGKWRLMYKISYGNYHFKVNICRTDTCFYINNRWVQQIVLQFGCLFAIAFADPTAACLPMLSAGTYFSVMHVVLNCLQSILHSCNAWVRTMRAAPTYDCKTWNVTRLAMSSSPEIPTNAVPENLKQQ